MFSVAESPLHLRFRCRKKQFAAQIPPSAAIVDRPRVAGARNTEILPPPKRGGYNKHKYIMSKLLGYINE